ncbi:unnamed protein product [Leptosia nina]|uniref:Immunoglobulin V-set domain-containing protein n=1 Tax=Leptosia nina TaxID=320188 RepID=A0AAV1J783_9NEOP
MVIYGYITAVGSNKAERITETTNARYYFSSSVIVSSTSLSTYTQYIAAVHVMYSAPDHASLVMDEVSWIRHRDLHILTVGGYTYTSDQRFQATHSPQTDDWTLQIKWAQQRDAGVYECQVSTQPVRSFFVTLHVVDCDEIYQRMFSDAECNVRITAHRSPFTPQKPHDASHSFFRSVAQGARICQALLSAPVFK